MDHLFSVRTLAELQAAMPDSSGAVMVLGHTSTADGGGGMFAWRGESTAEPDGGIVVRGYGKEKGRWHRVESDPINVRWFGAKGDGAEATDAIQAALNAAPRGGMVRVPAGVYAISRPLKMHQGTHLTGDGLLSVLQYSGPARTGCLASATPELSCAFHVTGLNLELQTEGSWGVDLRGISFSRFDNMFAHLRVPRTSAYYGPGNGQSPYYNLFTSCHISGPGNEDNNGCVGFDFTYDEAKQHQAPNANQVLGGHINSCQTAVKCYGTGNVFYAQVLEQNETGYLLGLPPARLEDASKGTSNTIAGCYTEYVKRVIVQEHESCYVTAELSFTTGYEQIFDGKSSKNSIVLTGHDGRLEVSRSFIHRQIEIR
jgi:hypothetical protein